MNKNDHYETIDEYIAQFPDYIQLLLESVRDTIRKAAPNAEECISYRIPTFKLHGNLVHFAGYEHHIGFYPGADGVLFFADEIAAYKSAKGSIQFPVKEKIPLDLITKITKFRVQQQMEKKKR